MLGTGGCHGCHDEPTAPARSPTIEAPEVLTRIPLEFLQVSTGSSKGCGVTTDHRACLGGHQSECLSQLLVTTRDLMNTPGRLLAALMLAVGVAACQHDTEAPTPPETIPGSAAASWTTREFRQVGGGAGHACGVATDNQAYCWGSNGTGELGVGSSSGPETCTVEFAGAVPCSRRPVLVVGDHSFRQISAGEGFTCGVTTRDVAFCWGAGGDGQLGNGTTTNRLRPVRVATEVRIRAVTAGSRHACAVSIGDIVYCWGWNGFGQLGEGTLDNRLVPTRRAGSVHFKTVSAGWRHSCGVGLDGRAYCWGLPYVSPGDALLKPTRIRGGRTFKQVQAAINVTCGLGTDNRAYCWGDNGDDLGSSSPTPDSLYQSKPLLVAGDRHYLAVSTRGFLGFGQNTSCGVTLGHVAYCWGHGAIGVGLGDGKTIHSVEPVKVAGGLPFRDVSTLIWGACAVTTADRAYCWGKNDTGQLGDGTTTDRPTPVPVAGM
jgi:alpha-tubulin suppressor-like RCC1 family protein